MYGPDEVIVSLNGKSLQSKIMLHAGCGHYHAMLRVPKDGWYHLSARRIRTNFTALDESFVDKNAVIKYENIVSEWIYLNETTNTESLDFVVQHNSTRMHPKACGGTWSLHQENPQFDFTGNISKVPPVLLNTCRNITGGLSGELGMPSYVNVSSSMITQLHPDLYCPCFVSTDLYEWVPFSPSEASNDCSLVESFTKREARSNLLKGKKIMIIGDSHARVLSNSFLGWACGIKVGGVRMGTLHKIAENIFAYSIPPNGPSCPGFEIIFIENRLCEWPPLKEQLGASDLVIFNCGHHPASHLHWPSEKYAATVENVFYTEILGNYSTEKVVWIESVPLPLRQDNDYLQSFDWRTLHRIHLFNHISSQIFVRHNYTVISAFEPVLPFVENMCDNAHYIFPEILLPIYEQIMAKVEQVAKARLQY
jgi:hypothetical protein